MKRKILPASWYLWLLAPLIRPLRMRTIIMLVLLVGGVWLTWSFAKAEYFSPSPRQEALMSRFQGEMARWLADEAATSQRTRVLVAAPDYDPIGDLHERTRRAAWESGRMRVLDRSAVEKSRDWLGLEPRGPSSIEEAVRSGRRRGADAVLFVELIEFGQVGSTAWLECRVVLAETATWEILAEREFSLREPQSNSIQSLLSPASADVASRGEGGSAGAAAVGGAGNPSSGGSGGSSWSSVGGVLAWALIALALPLFLSPAVRYASLIRSDRAMSLLMATQVILIVVTSYLLVLRGFGPLATLILMVAIGFAATVYTFFSMKAIVQSA